MIRTSIQNPISADNQVIPLGYPQGTALAVTYDATISGATSVTLNAGTTSFEVTAIDKGIFLRYAASASSSAFDAFIPQNTTRFFAKPDGVTTISVIEESATAKVVVIER